MAAIAAAVGSELVASSSSTAASPIHVLRGERPPALGEARGERGGAPGEPGGGPPGAPREPRGAVRGGPTASDDGNPAVGNLDPALLGALRQAARDAMDDGIELVIITSGWRSPEHQQQLFGEAVSKYGSKAEAARWVATPNTSEHVSGNAVNVGPSAATGWLSARGARYGLCQIYRNEPWHYELRPDAGDHGCPPMYADATQDPRMQQ